MRPHYPRDRDSCDRRVRFRSKALIASAGDRWLLVRPRNHEALLLLNQLNKQGESRMWTRCYQLEPKGRESALTGVNTEALVDEARRSPAEPPGTGQQAQIHGRDLTQLLAWGVP